jgi:PAS domain S-box-containing protein
MADQSPIPVLPFATTRPLAVARTAESVLDDLDAIVWARDPATLRCTFVTQGVERLTGWTPGDWRVSAPRWAQRTLHDEDRSRVLEALRDVAAGGAARQLEYRLRTADGRVLWMRDAVRAAIDAEGRVAAVQGVMIDVTARCEMDARLRERAEELSRLAAALERSNRELDAFAYAASHDLRAPLRGIANLAQWIEEDMEDTLSESTREMLALLRSRMDRMEGLIDGILEYSRAGRVHHRPTRVSVARLVRDVVDLLSPDSAMVSIDPDLPEVMTERLPLQQVFQNLIGNAVKHGGPGVRIDLSARDAGACWEFRVSDDGPGIAPEFHDRVWGIFQTLEARDKVEGAGIGLSLVKKLVESQGGRVWIESSPGEGATFAFLWRKTASPAEAT